MFDRVASRRLFAGCPCCITPDVSGPGAMLATVEIMAASGGATATQPRSAARSAPGGARRIDVHHHIAPPKWLTDVIGRDLLQPATRNWSVEKSLEDMDQGDVATAAVSVTNPGLWFGDKEQSRRLARDSNEFMARMVHDRPARFGVLRCDAAARYRGHADGNRLRARHLDTPMASASSPATATSGSATTHSFR